MRYRLDLPVLVALSLFFLTATIPATAAPASSDTAAFRIAPDALEALAATGARIARIDDYGAFLWVTVDGRDSSLVERSGLVAARLDFTLDLGGVRFDPLVAPPVLPVGWDGDAVSGPAARADLQLVQLTGPVRAPWLARLKEAGLLPVRYVHPHSYVVWGTAADLARASVMESDFVRWSGPFAPAYRVLPRWRDLPADPVAVDFLLVRHGDVAAALAAIEGLGGDLLTRRDLDGTFHHASFLLPGDLLQQAARIPGVYSIQTVPTDGGLRGEMSNQVNAGNVDMANAAFPGYESWLTSVGLSGAGVLMSNVDGGVNETHPDLAGQFVACTGTTCSGTSSTHGSHTAGIMGASGASGVTDGLGFLRGLGMAPGATMIEQNYSPFFLQAGGMLLIMQDSFANGALVSGNSWGPAGSPRGYDDDTMQVDIGVRDADPVAAGDQEFSYVLSFMNGGGGTSTQGTPDEAKNLFNIGSTKMQTSGGAQILDIDDISSNSAHGPALDGRTIPHMVAPGCRVDSTVTGSGYGLSCGTSMASPHVTGAVALFIEYIRGLGFADPSPALVKAAFLPAAHDLAGNEDADGGTLGHPFDNKQGWGRMNLPAVVDPDTAVAYIEQDTLLDNSGEEWSLDFTIDDITKPVKIMLVWTDAPGHGLGGSTPAWNNDLDLEVEVGADLYLGNNFGASGWSVTGGSADTMNNTEGVFLGPAAPASQIVIHVKAADINSDGVPSEGDGTDQDFALVCYNCVDPLAEPPLFADDFESGDLTAWDETMP